MLNRIYYEHRNKSYPPLPASPPPETEGDSVPLLAVLPPKQAKKSRKRDRKALEEPTPFLATRAWR